MARTAAAARIFASNDAIIDAQPACGSAFAMRTTLAIDDDLLAKAQALTGMTEKSALIREALQALIARESARRLARLGGSEPQLEPVRRRRPGEA
ncbi:type II toxin-antitoxin system VapB family antitoxin [Xanthobacter autotrophicus]|uniref:type II toxin-antitoxin system VapB family antitoxin n=2 Tax=Xanthobacter autotrophicus TaxID=280 RepID=UPI00373612A4